MLYDLRIHKTLPMVALCGAFVCAVALFVYINTATQFLNRTGQFFERARSAALFALAYQRPWEQGAAVAVAGSGSARAIPVLLYHGTPSEGNDNPPLPQSVFVDQLRALKADGWQTITMAQFTDFMKHGTPLPEKSFLLTFDDGRRESFYPVDPVLKDLDYTAVMFVISGFSLPHDGEPKSSFYLDRNELHYMVDSGRWELESHGDEDHRLYDVPSATPQDGVLTTLEDEHFLSNKFWLEAAGRVETTDEYTARITKDLTVSHDTLEQEFGKPVTAFAYPFNDYGQNSRNFPGARDILAEVIPSIYTFAFYQVDPGKEDPFNYPDASRVQIKRIEPVASWSGAYVVALLDNANAKTLPYKAQNIEHEWSSNWGSVTTQDGVLSLRARSDTSGAVALLNGSQSWQNYTLSMNVAGSSGDAISLIARYVSDSETFLTCAFTPGRIDLQAHENGVQTTLESAPIPAGTPLSELTMTVDGASVSCTAGSTSVKTDVKSSFVHAGSTGVQIWGKTTGTESLDVHQASVHAP